MVTGVVAVTAFGIYYVRRKRRMRREFERFSSFIEKVTFESIPFQQRQEAGLGYDVYFYQEDKFSLEIWKKEDSFIMYVNDDEINKPIFKILKNEDGVDVFHPTVFYYRHVMETKKKLFQSFIHRYIGKTFETVEEAHQEKELAKGELANLEGLPEEICTKIQAIKGQYDAIMEKQDDLDIQDYTLIETLVFNDLQNILATYKELSPENQEELQGEVIEGMEDISRHLGRIEKRFENEQVFELKKNLRVLKQRGE